MIWIIFILFLFLFILPFLPGIIELVKNSDSDPLYIPMDYIRNPRYFGKSFKNMLHESLKNGVKAPRFVKIKLSKPEKLEIAKRKTVSELEVINHILFVDGDLSSDNTVKFNKEIYVTGDSTIGSNNIVQAMASEGSVMVGNGTCFRRWIDSEGDIYFESGCILGISASSGSKMYLSENCTFRRLFAMPISTGTYRNCDRHYSSNEFPAAEFNINTSGFKKSTKRNLPSNTKIFDSVVFSNDIEIGENSTILGTIKSYGSIILTQNITIYGNVLADKDVFVGPGTNINGHVFSQMNVYLSKYTIISRPEMIKSVIGKRSVKIEPNVIIYGFVATEGSGRIISESMLKTQRTGRR